MTARDAVPHNYLAKLAHHLGSRRRAELLGKVTWVKYEAKALSGFHRTIFGFLVSHRRTAIGRPLFLYHRSNMSEYHSSFTEAIS